MIAVVLTLPLPSFSPLFTSPTTTTTITKPNPSFSCFPQFSQKPLTSPHAPIPSPDRTTLHSSMERRRSLPRKQFPHSKAKTATAEAAEDREFPVADTGRRGALCEDEEDDEEKRMKFSSPSKTVIAAPYPPGWHAKRTVLTAAGGSGSHPCCVVEKCTANLSEAKRYYRRHKVCEAHSKAPVVIIAGLRQRFCQQCSRFHELSEFDEAKRSCRRRLVGHNERRRKSSSEPQGEGSNHFRPAD